MIFDDFFVIPRRRPRPGAARKYANHLTSIRGVLFYNGGLAVYSHQYDSARLLDWCCLLRLERKAVYCMQTLLEWI